MLLVTSRPQRAHPVVVDGCRLGFTAARWVLTTAVSSWWVSRPSYTAVAPCFVSDESSQLWRLVGSEQRAGLSPTVGCFCTRRVSRRVRKYSRGRVRHVVSFVTDVRPWRPWRLLSLLVLADLERDDNVSFALAASAAAAHLVATRAVVDVSDVDRALVKMVSTYIAVGFKDLAVGCCRPLLMLAVFVGSVFWLVFGLQAG